LVAASASVKTLKMSLTMQDCILHADGELADPTSIAKADIDEIIGHHLQFGCDMIDTSLQIREQMLHIHKVGQLLVLSRLCCETAQILLKRFYVTKKVHEYDCFTTAMSCILIASKAVERQIKIKNLLQCCSGLSRQNMTNITMSPFTVGSEVFIKWKTEVLQCEHLILSEVGFNIYDIMRNTVCAHIPQLITELQCDEDGKLLELTLKLSDQLDYTNEQPSRVVAGALIYLAALKSGWWLPDDRWNILSTPMLSPDKLRELAHTIDSRIRSTEDKQKGSVLLVNPLNK
jgi:hypothetical protein